MPPDSPPGDAPVDSSRNFIIYAVGQSISAAGMWMQRMAIGWIAWDLTHSAAWVGAMALTELVAALWVAPLAGVITDRSNPYRLSLMTQGSAIFVALALYGATEAGIMTIWLLWLLALADSTWQGLNQPVRMTVVSLLAGRENMSRALAFNAMGFNLARAIGPVFAGIIIVQGDAADVFLVDLLTFAVMMVVLVYLRRLIDRPVRASKETVFHDIVDGYHYVVRTPAVSTVFLLLLGFSFLGRPFIELFPAIAGQMLGGGAGELSMLMSVQGIGAVIGGLWMMRRHAIPSLARMSFIAGFGMSVALVLFSILDGLPISLALVAVAGFCHIVCNIGMQSLAQLFADSAFRGRTMALYSLILRAGPAASAALIGLGAEWVGLQPLIGAAAALFALCVVLIGGRARRIYLTGGPA